jgi:hypothetical protein
MYENEKIQNEIWSVSTLKTKCDYENFAIFFKRMYSTLWFAKSKRYIAIATAVRTCMLYFCFMNKSLNFDPWNFSGVKTSQLRPKSPDTSQIVQSHEKLKRAGARIPKLLLSKKCDMG